MERLHFILLLFSISTAFAQTNPWDDKVICNGSTIALGDNGDSKLCYSWKSTPADPSITNLKDPKINVAPSQTTTYTRTSIGDEFSSASDNSVKVIVIDPTKYIVDFEENPNQNFGFDKVAGSTDIYLSLDKSGGTKVNVKITPFLPNAFCITSSDPTKFKVPNDSVLVSGGTTVINLMGQNPNNAHESANLEVRCTNRKGSIIKILNVELYKKVDVNTVFYYRIKDPNVSATIPSRNPTKNQLKADLNSVYKQAVIEILNVDGDQDKNIAYDINKNGYLDFYRGGSNPELDMIQDKASGLTGSPKIAYVEKIRKNWRVTSIINDKTLQVESVLTMGTGTDYSFSSPTGTPETISVASIDPSTNVITLTNSLTANHDLTHTIYTGLAGLSSDPQLVTDAGNELIITIVHEILHTPMFGNLVDVKEADNVMYWTTGGTQGVRRLRYRPQTEVDTGEGKPNGNFQNQWNTIIR